MKVALLAGLILLLSGCGMFSEYRALRGVVKEGIDTAVEDRRSFNDTKAGVIKALAGDVSRGAMLREYSPEEQCAIDTLILGMTPEWCKSDNTERLAEAIERLVDSQ
jgi:hypothetical protein